MASSLPHANPGCEPDHGPTPDLRAASTGQPEQAGDDVALVAHEQVAVDWPVAPDLSRLVIGSGFTVAHLWTRR